MSHCKHFGGDQQRKASGLSHGMGWTAQGEEERGQTIMEKVSQLLSQVERVGPVVSGNVWTGL